jgi:hypothetical protein
VAKYIGMGLNNKIISQIGEDTKTVLSYIGTVIITAVFTKFIESNKK